MEEYHHRMRRRAGRQRQLADLCARRPIVADTTTTKDPRHPTGLPAGPTDRLAGTRKRVGHRQEREPDFEK
jgi:hypothetical protein